MRNLMNYKNRLDKSQHGEDGMIVALLKSLNINKGHSVELGANDGIHGSNTLYLIKRGWLSLYIESDDDLYKKCEENMKQYPNVTCINSSIGVNEDKKSNLNIILAEHNIPIDFDVFSLDTDGNDYWIWKDFEFKPKIAVIEYNGERYDQHTVMPYTKGYIDQDKMEDPKHELGCGAYNLIDLSREKGYILIGSTRPNLIFIRKDLNDNLEEPYVEHDIKAWLQRWHNYYD